MMANSMNSNRCPWLDESKPDYVKYHDEEWGVPVYDDKKMFEFIVLESAQAGLSWYTILKRREGYKKAFADFDVEKVAQYTEQDVERLMGNAEIIRNRAKIKATISNAKSFISVQKEFGSFSDYLWGFVKHTPIVNKLSSLENYPATSEISDEISSDLKKRGFKFFGSTICYAHLQACGLYNDHSENCFRKQEIIEAYK